MNKTNQSAKLNSKKIDIGKMTLIAIFSALAGVIMMLDFSLPLLPVFYKIDFSEVIVLIGGFSLGPVAAIVIEFLKIVINTLFKGTSTAYIGEAANFIVGCLFVVPATIIYKKNATKKMAVIGLIFGSISLTVFASLLNYYVILPVYSYFTNTPLDVFISMGTKENSSINSLKTLVLFATVPFNLLKAVVSSVITLLVYKHLSPIIKGIHKK